MPQDPNASPAAPAQSSYTKKCPACYGAGNAGWKRLGDDYESIPCDVCLGNGSILVLVTPAPSGREVLALDNAALVNVPATPITPATVTTTTAIHEGPTGTVQTSPRILGDEFGAPGGGYSWGAK